MSIPSSLCSELRSWGRRAGTACLPKTRGGVWTKPVGKACLIPGTCRRLDSWTVLSPRVQEFSVTPSDGAEAILEGPSGELPHFPLSIAPCFLLRPFPLRLFLLFTGFPSLLGCGQSFGGFEQWSRVLTTSSTCDQRSQKDKTLVLDLLPGCERYQLSPGGGFHGLGPVSLGKQVPTVTLKTREGPWLEAPGSVPSAAPLPARAALPGRPQAVTPEMTEGALANHLCINHTNVGWWPTTSQQLLELRPWTRQTSVLLLQKFNPEKSHHLNQKWERLGGEGQREIMDRRREKRVLFPEGKRHICCYIWSVKSCPIMWPQDPLNIIFHAVVALTPVSG